MDDLLRKRLKDSSELPGALWHIYAGKDVDKIREFLQKVRFTTNIYYFELNNLTFRTDDLCVYFTSKCEI